jgi:5-methylcytosine-specific restriction endonuclease McrA
MNERTFRCPFTFLLVFALLLAALPSLAGAAEDPRITPQERAAFEAVAPAEAKSCQRCAVAHKKCSTTCFGLAEKGGMGDCLTACDNAVATCSCDQPVSLRSEDLVAGEWPGTTKAAACHGNVSCQPNYPSCASWTSYADCGDAFCGSGPRCGDCTCDEWGHCFCGPGPAWREPMERFRVCFDSLGNSCTEWQTLTFISCGC